MEQNLWERWPTIAHNNFEKMPPWMWQNLWKRYPTPLHIIKDDRMSLWIEQKTCGKDDPRLHTIMTKKCTHECGITCGKGGSRNCKSITVTGVCPYKWSRTGGKDGKCHCTSMMGECPYEWRRICKKDSPRHFTSIIMTECPHEWRTCENIARANVLKLNITVQRKKIIWKMILTN